MGIVSKEVVDALLVGVDDIDWSAVTHAYGPAVEVPQLLRVWLSNDQRAPGSVDYLGLAISTDAGATMSECAAANLWGSVFHQGTIYEATAPVAQLLQKVMVEAPLLEQRLRAAQLLLTCLARYRVGWMASSFSVAEHDRPEVYRAAASGWSSYLGLLDPSVPADLRATVARMLPWLDEPTAVAAAIFQQLSVGPSDTEVDALLLLALGAVARPASAEVNGLLRSWFHESPDIAVPAAIALGRLHLVDPDVDHELISVIEDAVGYADGRFTSQPGPHYGREGSVSECAADALLTIDLLCHGDAGSNEAIDRAEETLHGLSFVLRERTLAELRSFHLPE